jgi:hypothetical protein
VAVGNHGSIDVLALGCRCGGFEAAGGHIAAVLVNVLHLQGTKARHSTAQHSTAQHSMRQRSAAKHGAAQRSKAWQSGAERREAVSVMDGVHFNKTPVMGWK